MPVITIASGKGGTGKTTLAVNLAQVLGSQGLPVHLMDCDVEEPNDQLFTRARFAEVETVTVMKPRWQASACIGCGRCVAACAFNALSLINEQIHIHGELCHACGVCSHVCEHAALPEQAVAIGMIEAAPDHRPFAFSQGRLALGESQAPAVIRTLKRRQDPSAITLIDASPGTACPVVEAMRGSDMVLLVTEPTPFGLHDLRLAANLTAGMGLPTAIVVNRSDGVDRIIADFAADSGLPIAARIPFKRAYAESYARGELLAESFPEVADSLQRMWRELAPARSQQVIPASSPFQSTSTQMSSEQAGSCRHQIAIISGKGGTGKTTITACFSQLADRHVLADTDVDAADLHLLLEPCRHGGGEFIGGNKARIHADRCRACGRCVVACRFDAITDDGQTPTVDEHACEGCGLCMRVCPHQAIICEPRVSGHWFVSDTDQGTLVHAELGIGEENSGKLVHRVRQEARLRAAVAAVGVLADGPPGTGCPVIASIGGCDLAVLITEPTVSGVHDLERVLALCGHFQVPAAVLLNKADLDREQAERVQTLARQFHARLIGAIPFDPAVHEALMAGRTVLDHGDGPAARAIRSAWDQVESLLDEGAP